MKKKESEEKKHLETFYKHDLPASMVVFLVALPLCLGIAQASGTSPIAGLIAGIVGGIVVGALSGSTIGVSGPAAGLAGLIVFYTDELHDYRIFLLVVILSGIIQFLFYVIKAGVIAEYFPFNVVKGMLAAIGLLLFLKQIPHGIGYDKDAIGDMAFKQIDGNNTFSEIWIALHHPHYGAIIITMTSIAILLLWQSSFIKKNRIISKIPSPLLVVIFGILLNVLFKHIAPDLVLGDNHLVNIPVHNSIGSLYKDLPSPDFNYLFSIIKNGNKDAIYQLLSMSFSIALVSSLACLLTLEATDKLDSLKRMSSPDKELKAQGIGNIIAGLLGGLPIAQVVIRSAANVNAGAKTKGSAIAHGILLLISVLTIPQFLDMIPKACLASILLVIGYKLTNFKLFVNMYKLKKRQFIPFIVTVLAILFTGILEGIVIGLIVSIYFILQNNRRVEPFDVVFKKLKNKELDYIVDFTLYREVNYLSKHIFLQSLHDIPAKSEVNIYGTKSQYISSDVIETIEDFNRDVAPRKDIQVNLVMKKQEKKRHR